MLDLPGMRHLGIYRLLRTAAMLLGMSALMGNRISLCATSESAPSPRMEDYATIEAYVGEQQIPVHAFGHLTYIYGVCPELLPGVVMQTGNSNPVVKIAPKKSWEIENSLVGTFMTFEPRGAWNDDQPFLPVHLIDGDPETVWFSRGVAEADIEPAWIRIDLPAESTVASIALVCRDPAIDKTNCLMPGWCDGIGSSLPGELTIKTSRNARDWESVYENKHFTGADVGPTVIDIEPQAAKQIWIIGNNLPAAANFGHAFSIAEVEVRDGQGDNLALVSRGAGVRVSSTCHFYGHDRYTQDILWPIQYDLGSKWNSIGRDGAMFVWQNVEREKGVLKIDARAKEAVSEAIHNGVNQILCIDTEANWLYHDPPRKVDWRKTRTRDMIETFRDHPGFVDQSPEMFAGYLRFVEYMANHFKGHAGYYELGNEWEGIHWLTPQEHVKIARTTIATIKKADPGAKIMLGATSGGSKRDILACLGKVPDVKAEVDGGALVVSGDGKMGHAVIKDANVKDVVVSVDARNQNRAAAGILLRFQDAGNYLTALYAPGEDSIFLLERVNDHWANPRARVLTGKLGPQVHLEARVEGARATFAVSDGEKTFRAEHDVRRQHQSGRLGLLNMTTMVRKFDNFRATAPDGAPIFQDDFDQAGEFSAAWEVLPGEKIEPGLGPQIDAIAWHQGPYASGFQEEVARFREECAEFGFKGKFCINEIYFGAPYPPGSPTEMQRAKQLAQTMIAFPGLDILALQCNTYQLSVNIADHSLLRKNFGAEPLTPGEPKPSYYVLRNVMTALDGMTPAPFEVKFDAQSPVECFTFRRGEREKMFAVWLGRDVVDGIAEEKCDILLPGASANKAWITDLMNGTEQELKVAPQGGDTLISGVLLKDYPLLVRFER